MSPPTPIRELGRGAFGVVYEALHRGERVALKVLREPDARSRAAFERARCIEHPNVVRMREWIEGVGFTMDLRPGEDLVRWVRQRPPTRYEGGRPSIPVAFGQRVQPEGTSAYVGVGEQGIARLAASFEPIVSALSAMHSAGIVHGDVRPGNIVVSDEGVPCLLDFGHSRTADEAAPHETSPAYAPPELDPSPAADFYALGTVLFECLTGQLPFFGSAQHMLVSKVTVTPPAVSFLVPNIPEDLDRLVAELLSRVPERRLLAVDSGRARLLRSVSR